MENSRSKQAITYDLISAVRLGRLERVKELINSFGLSYSEAWLEGYVLLRDALKNNHTAVAKLLLTSGSKVIIENEEITDTPVHFAVMNGDIEIVQMILDRGANVEAKNQHGKTPLHIAAEKGYLKMTEHLLEYGAYINCVCAWRDDYTPLHFAVEKSSIEIIMLLLSRGVNVDVKSKDNVTPLHIAAKNGYIRIAEDLLNHGACIDSSTLKEGYTPLHFASEQGKEGAVELLLHRGADINARTKNNSTPLHIATKKGCVKILKLLLQHKAQVDNQDKDGKTILNIAVEKENLAIVEDILKYCPDINNKSNKSSLKIAVHGSGEESKKICKALLEYGLTVNPEDANDPELFHYVVQRGYLKIIEDLLKYGADVNTCSELYSNKLFIKNFTPLHRAVRNKQEDVAELLIRYKADTNAQESTGKTPIFYAIENADSKITQLLLTSGADVKGNPELLNIAVKKECIEIVEALLQHDAGIYASDEYERTALHFTASSESKGTSRGHKNNYDINIKGKIAKLLLSKGANVNAQTKDGITTLHAAIEGGYVGVVGALLEYNANVNCKDKSDNTPLHISARKGNKDISIMLLNKGANINAKQKDGTTPLHLAVQQSHNEIVEVLLECGANVNSRMKNNMTPLHLAAENGYPEIIETILKCGADIDSTDEDGRTALHISSKNEHDNAVATLLEYGSDMNITSKNNHTALDHAIDGIRSFCTSFDGYDSDNYNSDDESHDVPGSVDIDECPHKYVAEVFKRHIVKMKIANLYVSEQNLLSMSRSHEISVTSDFQNECQEEVARMKSENISNCNISFYDVLSKDTSSLVIYMKNNNLVHILKSDNYKTRFPIYARIIENNFRKAMERKELLERSRKIYHIFFNSLPKLPYDCIETITSYLSDGDLRNLIDACKPLGITNSNTNTDDVAITSSISQV